MSVPRPGFARRHGVDPGELEVRDGFLGIEQPGRALRDVLPESIDAVVRGLAFNRTMRWDDSGLRYPRPVRWVLAKLDEDTLQGEHSFGHRFTHGPVEIPAAGEYATRLRAAGVEPVAAERRRTILEGLPEGWSDPAGVLDEVVHLVEWPVVLESAFDARFLDLPRDVVIAAMQSHQRYFPLEGNRFAFVSNGGDPDVVRAGNTQVLENRLDDAAFSFERDVKVGIDGLAGRLGGISFFEGGGTFADKVERLQKLAGRLGGGEATLEAARLAKADQASELVREFPELEGRIGAEYARLAGYPEAVCAAVAEQYLPGLGRGAASLDRERPRPLRSGQDRHSHRFVLARAIGRRARATPSACAAPRSGFAGSPPRAPSRFRGHSSRGRSPISSRSGSRGCSTSRSNSSARLDAPRSRSSARSHSSPRRSHSWTTRRSTGSTPPTRAPIGWPVAPRRRLRTLNSDLLGEQTEVDLAREVGRHRS